MMEITGVRTDIQRVKVEIDILEALKEMDHLNRKRLEIPLYCWVDIEDGNYVLKQEEDCYHGTPWDVVIDKNPSGEVIEYLSAYKTFYQFTHKTKYAKV